MPNVGNSPLYLMMPAPDPAPTYMDMSAARPTSETAASTAWRRVRSAASEARERARTLTDTASSAVRRLSARTLNNVDRDSGGHGPLWDDSSCDDVFC